MFPLQISDTLTSSRTNADHLCPLFYLSIQQQSELNVYMDGIDVYMPEYISWQSHNLGLLFEVILHRFVLISSVI